MLLLDRTSISCRLDGVCETGGELWRSRFMHSAPKHLQHPKSPEISVPHCEDIMFCTVYLSK